MLPATPVRVSSICFLALILSTGGILVNPLPLYAQVAPDAGSILRQQPQPPVAAPAPPQRVLPAQPKAEQPDDGPRVLVKGFRILGAALLSEAELAAQLQEIVGRELSLRQLEGAAATLTSYYVQRGYVARVIVPPQDVRDGIVTLRVIEGRRGGVRVTPQGERIDAQQVAHFIDYRLPKGAALDMAPLGEALAVLNEQPGLSVRATAAPGQGESEIDLLVVASQTPWAQPFVNANNHGLAGTGKNQISGGVVLNNASGRLDALSILVNESRGSHYGRVDYSLPVGYSGLRLGLNASHLRYEIVQPALAALRAEGTAKTWGLMGSYPLVRRENMSLSLQGSLEEKELLDKTVAGETGNRRVIVGGLGINGYQTGSGLLPEGVISFGAGVVMGNSSQRNATARANDAATRGTHGSLSKLHYNLGLLQPLPATWRLNAALRGQFASGNLDSSERFTLGGPSGVRGYPVGEAIGDEGWLLNLNFTRPLNAALSASFFYDLGGIKLNDRLWAGWNAATPTLDNSYRLSAIGAGLDWRIAPKAVLTASVAKALESNPGRDVNGNNADGSNDRTRGWINLSVQF